MNSHKAETTPKELTPAHHQSYVAARKQQEMDYINDYETWLDAHQELAAITDKNARSQIQHL